jgi:tRNA-dihydrouridine synthase B
MLPLAQTISTFADGIAIGPHRLPGRAILAPMSGITDIGMRRLAQRFGASMVVSEMVDSAFYTSGDASSAAKADGVGIDCHVVQIAGCQAGNLADAARLAQDQGAAIVDINMGCPAKKVVGGLAGSALMRDLDQATALIRATVAAVSVPVTLKMRLGWDDGSINAPELARRAEAEGVAMVTVHGRTRCQFYKGTANWGAIRAVKDAVSIPVVANGNCNSVNDALEMLRRSRADAVMIGRAALGQPWLVGDIAHALASGERRAPPSAAARQAAALEHYDLLLSLYGVDKGVRHARKHLAAYALHAGCDPASDATQALVTRDRPDTVRALLAAIFDMTNDISFLEKAA